MCLPFTHKWSKWEQYTANGFCYGIAIAPRKEGIPFSERRQRRHCILCNKEQDERVRPSLGGNS